MYTTSTKGFPYTVIPYAAGIRHWERQKLHLFDAICASAARGVARKKSAASATCAARAEGEASLKATRLPE